MKRLLSIFNFSMRPFLKNIILFGLFAGIVYCILLFISGALLPLMWRPNLPFVEHRSGHSYSRIAEADQTGNIDVLIIGSSHAYRGVDTRNFEAEGYKAFNLGSSAQTPMQSNMLLEMYAEQLDPELVVLEVFPSSLSMDGVESSIDLLSSMPLRGQLIELALAQKNAQVYNTLLYAGMYGILMHDEGKKEDPRKGGDMYISGGYVERKDAFFDPENEVPQPDSTYRKEQLESLDAIIEMLNNANTEYVLVQAPVTDAFYELYHNPDSFDMDMMERGMYFNFNDLPSLRDTLHFYDYHHLNAAGVKEFNDALIDSLLAHGLLYPKRQL